jgi:hypothetical protein
MPCPRSGRSQVRVSSTVQWEGVSRIDGLQLVVAVPLDLHHEVPEHPLCARPERRRILAVDADRPQLEHFIAPCSQVDGLLTGEHRVAVLRLGAHRLGRVVHQDLIECQARSLLEHGDGHAAGRVPVGLQQHCRRYLGPVVLVQERGEVSSLRVPLEGQRPVAAGHEATRHVSRGRVRGPRWHVVAEGLGSAFLEEPHRAAVLSSHPVDELVLVRHAERVDDAVLEASVGALSARADLGVVHEQHRPSELDAHLLGDPRDEPVHVRQGPGARLGRAVLGRVLEMLARPRDRRDLEAVGRAAQGASGDEP